MHDTIVYINVMFLFYIIYFTKDECNINHLLPVLTLVCLALAQFFSTVLILLKTHNIVIQKEEQVKIIIYIIFVKIMIYDFKMSSIVKTGRYLEVNYEKCPNFNCAIEKKWISNNNF